MEISFLLLMKILQFLLNKLSLLQKSAYLCSDDKINRKSLVTFFINIFFQLFLLELTVYLGQVTFTPLFISNTRQVWQNFCSKSPLEDLKREYIVEIETEWGKITVEISYLVKSRNFVNLTFHENSNHGGEITENLGFESLIRKVKKMLSFFSFYFQILHTQLGIFDFNPFFDILICYLEIK